MKKNHKIQSFQKEFKGKLNTVVFPWNPKAADNL